MLWCFARVFMPAPAGRQRFNVLGALNAIFKDFKSTISECLAQTRTTYKQELDTLLTLRFQTFKKSQFITR